jgi:transcriptional regulator GlxA family with amidase domain
MILEPTLDAAAARFGYGSPGTLNAHFHSFVGAAPRRARRSLTVEAFVARLVCLATGR